jgi:hypothetical protein
MQIIVLAKFQHLSEDGAGEVNEDDDKQIWGIKISERMSITSQGATTPKVVQSQ